MSHEGTSLRALAFELKHPLTLIARQAEVADQAAIERTAQQALQLIDSYLLHAQAEYGQTTLDLEPTSVGSVLYDASTYLSNMTTTHNTSFLIDDRTHDLVMTNRAALISVLTSFGNMMVSFDTPKHQEIVLRGYKTRGGGLGVGMFSEQSLTQADVDRALELQGSAHMPLAQVSHSAHVSLTIADGLCRAIGGKMQVKRLGRLTGLATELPRSEQLAFV